jgi:hypothetical protein
MTIQLGKLTIPLSTQIDLVKSFLLIFLAAWQVLRLRRVTDPVKRQLQLISVDLSLHPQREWRGDRLRRQLQGHMQVGQLSMSSGPS